MDDQNFDQQTALDWIKSVENPTSNRSSDIFPKLRDWINAAQPGEILDIGCGQGICSEQIDLSRCNYTGVEPSPYMIERAKQLYTQANRKFLLGNAYHLPSSDVTFDSVFSVLVWHLLSDIEKAANELGRVLKKDGQFLLITANPGNYSAWKDLYSDLQLVGNRLEGTMQLGNGVTSHDVLYLHSFDEIQTALQNSQLEVQHTETFRKDYLILIRGRKLD